MSTDRYTEALGSLAYIKRKSMEADAYMRRLLYANVITVFESYLYGVFVDSLRSNRNYLEALVNSSKYKNHKIPLHKALTNDLQQYTIGLLKHLIFHNLNDIQPLFKEVLGVDFKILPEHLNAIEKRHDIVHRNGYTDEWKCVEITQDDIADCISVFRRTIEEIREQLKEN